MQIPKQFAFNHDTKSLIEALGLPDGYNEVIEKVIHHAEIDCNYTLEIFETVLNKMKPQTAVQVAYIGFAVGGFQMSKLKDANLMAQMRMILRRFNEEED